MNTHGPHKVTILVEQASFLTDTGTANTYVVAFNPAITAYTTGLKVKFKAANANSGSSTLNVNSLGAITIKKNVTTNLASGDILLDQIVECTYDGTNFQIVSGAGGGGTSGFSGYSGPVGTSGFSGYSGAGTSGFSGYSGVGTSGFSGYSGLGLSGFSGYSGPVGTSGFSGYSGPVGTSGFSGYSGLGLSGFSGYSGPVGTSGFSGYSGPVGTSGFSGYSGAAGSSGFSGYSGPVGTSGFSGYSGVGTSGFSGYSGLGLSGFSGYSGGTGNSGFSGYSGSVGTSGFSGYSGPIGTSGFSGYSGIVGTSGFSGYSGVGTSGFSGYSGPSDILFTEQTSSYTLAITDANKGVAMNVGSANNLTVPPNSSVAFTVGTQIVIQQKGAGLTTIVAGGGVTIEATSLVMAGQHSVACLIKKGTDIWLLSTGVGYSGYSGYSGPVGTSGFSGYSGVGTSGFSGYSGVGTSGFSGYSGLGLSGYSGYSGPVGTSGFSGYSGTSGYSAYSGASPAGQIILTAAGGWPSITSGCTAASLTETATNKNNYYSLAFGDNGVANYAEWNFPMPSDYNAGTVTAIFYWITSSATANNVEWGIDGVSWGDNETLDLAYGTRVLVTDTNNGAGKVNISAATSAVTLAGTPAAGDLVSFRVRRDSSQANDTLAASISLIAVRISYTRS